MTQRYQEGADHNNERALAQAEQYYDRQNPAQLRPLKRDSDSAWEFDWLFRRNIED